MAGKQSRERERSIIMTAIAKNFKPGYIFTAEELFNMGCCREIPRDTFNKILFSLSTGNARLERVDYGEYLLKEETPIPTPSPILPIKEKNTYSIEEVGIAIVKLVDKLREENEELRQLMDDYDQIVNENRILKERVTELSTRWAENGRKLQL